MLADYFCNDSYTLTTILYAKTGGYLNRIRPSLKFLCPAEHIPSKIEVDVSNLDIGDRILMHDVEVHPSLKLLSKNETMPVCKIVAAKLERAESGGIEHWSRQYGAFGIHIGSTQGQAVRE